ncbi:hypothetical protein HDU93_002629 [Gonapodya sp. JEL0774]|nr:hypothetical protein HDU93_002629 [Gonapodya sp. JEL0774]
MGIQPKSPNIQPNSFFVFELKEMEAQVSAMRLPVAAEVDTALPSLDAAVITTPVVRVPSSLDTLPTEILHRIFRLLPPQLFYFTIPRVCRRIHYASQGAIPGCSGLSVTIQINVLLAETSSKDGQRIRPLRRFTAVMFLGGETVWASFSTDMHVTIAEVEGSQYSLEQLALSRIANSPDKIQERGKSLGRSLLPRVVFSGAGCGMKLLCGYSIEHSWIAKLGGFVRDLSVPKFTFGYRNSHSLSETPRNSELISALVSLEEMPSVTTLECLSTTDWDGLDTCLALLLRLLPNTTNLTGDFILDSSDAQWVLDNVSQDRRDRIVRLVTTGGDFLGGLRPSQLAELLNLFPMVTELGVLYLRCYMWDLGGAPLESATFPNIRTLHCLFDFLSIPTPDDMLHAATGVQRQYPNLRKLLIKLHTRSRFSEKYRENLHDICSCLRVLLETVQVKHVTVLMSVGAPISGDVMRVFLAQACRTLNKSFEVMEGHELKDELSGDVQPPDMHFPTTAIPPSSHLFPSTVPDSFT